MALDYWPGPVRHVKLSVEATQTAVKQPVPAFLDRCVAELEASARGSTLYNAAVFASQGADLHRVNLPSSV